ncbi:hypothetical protein [Microtetraspora sp. NBRC 13810]|uniref:hypothetical protein n=1 Tax=Microtetraspora sp. NBRC 13810 TaxID=3030990 RepID=UPI00332DEC2F
MEADVAREDPEFARLMTALQLEEPQPQPRPEPEPSEEDDTGEITPARLALIGLAILGICVLLPLLLGSLAGAPDCTPRPGSSPAPAAQLTQGVNGMPTVPMRPVCH